MKLLLDRTFCLNDYRNGWKSRLTSDKKSIVVGVCAGNTNEAMGYTIKGMINPISELGVQIIDIIEYYNTKNVPVYSNCDIQKEITNRIDHIFE